MREDYGKHTFKPPVVGERLVIGRWAMCVLGSLALVLSVGCASDGREGRLISYDSFAAYESDSFRRVTAGRGGDGPDSLRTAGLNAPREWRPLGAPAAACCSFTVWATRPGPSTI